jgi:hypothetical protein
METLEDTDIKKTRKPHRCFGCLEMIPIGSPAHMQTIADGGCVYSNYTHTVCQQVIDNMDLRYGDEIDEGCVIEEMHADNFEGTPEEYLKAKEAERG